MSIINIAGIYHNDGVNGPGLRTTVFVQGCSHHCKGCHSPHTWKIGHGTNMTDEELYTEITSSKIDTGVTFSGGDPMLQAKELLPVVKRLKQKPYHLMMYTGYTKEELDNLMTDDEIRTFVRLFDLIVTDRFELAQRDTTLLFRGSRNQRIFAIKDGETMVDVTCEFN